LDADATLGLIEIRSCWLSLIHQRPIRVQLYPGA